CRKAGLAPDAVVVVATARALKMHGGVALAALGNENVAAVKAGGANLARHLANVRQFGVPALVAVNRFPSDTEAELQAVTEVAAALDVPALVCTHWADGGAGTEALARRVVEVVEAGEADFRPLYPDDMPLWDKVETVAKRIYHAGGVTATPAVRNRFKALQDGGYGHYPVCMAKTQYSFSTDPALKGAPEGHEVQVRELRLSAGAEFVVAICGDMMTMPGLPRTPAAESIHVNAQGQVEGLS
ncbi:MAG: formate--tetrahydrofolate ligase, partial [Deltaproteobacteria bacterium]|nr:formate--tetrahydrofolate ligase [Deltaproteobacteria bacterium]